MSAVKDEKELVNIATWGVFETMGVYAEPSFWDIERWHKGIPSYGINHKECVDGIFEKLKDRKGLFLNSNSYRGVRIADCIKNSKLTAVSVIGG
jgi:oxygen-dependent protoporphyrinogen oxidase